MNARLQAIERKLERNGLTGKSRINRLQKLLFIYYSAGENVTKEKLIQFAKKYAWDEQTHADNLRFIDLLIQRT